MTAKYRKALPVPVRNPVRYPVMPSDKSGRMKMSFYCRLRTLLCVWAALCGIVVSAAALSEREQASVDQFMQFRMEVSACEPDEALARVARYETELFGTEEASSFSPEFRLIMDNLLVLERYNYLYEKDIAHPELEGLISAQNDENESRLKNAKGARVDTWLYCTAGDVISCCMQFMPVTKAMNRGLVIKKYYDTAVSQDPDCAYALMNTAQWYFHAPAIGGGSKKKALDYFERAIAAARTPAESFYAKILCSQALFDGGSTERSAALLAEATALCPESRYAAHIKKLNDAGYSLFYYMLNRAKIDAELR